MNIRQIRYFTEIIRTQSYSTAAKNLFVTQPTLSWNMNKLQDTLGVKLLYQVRNKVMPTTAGSLLYQRGKKIVKDLDSLTNDLIYEATPMKKELTIGSNSVISPFFMPLIEGFMEEHPSISITIEEAGSIITQKKVSKEELEIGIVSYPIVESDLEIETNIYHSFQYDAYITMRNDHPLAKKETLAFKDLKDYTFASVSKDYVLWYVLHDKARENGFQPKISFLSNNHEVLLNNILTTGTIGILPIQLRDKKMPLTWVKIDDKMKPFEIVVVHKKNNALSPIAAEFLEYVINNRKKIGK